MKIICVGKNYSEHITEMKSEAPTSPVIFFKPDTALLKNNQAFYHPSFSENIHYEVELVLRISREGKLIEEKFAHKYFDAIGLGIDFTARDIQEEAKKKSLPWAIAKGFNHSAPISEFIPVEEFKDVNNISFSLEKNNTLVQKGNNANMIFSFSKILAYISQFINLKKGDFIFTGTPSGVGKISIGDQLTGYIETKKLLDFEIK